MSSFQNLYLNVFCYFHPTQIFVKTLIYLQALAGSGSCVIACTPPQTIRWKFQKYSASLIKLELLFFFFFFFLIFVCETTASCAELCAFTCLFVFWGCFVFHNYLYSCFHCIKFSKLEYECLLSYFHPQSKFSSNTLALNRELDCGSCVISCTPGPPPTIRWRLQRKIIVAW